MIRFVSLTSGSSGNSTLVTDGKTNILVDCGVSGKNAAGALARAGVDIDDIDALLITHEHCDHIKGAGVIVRRHGIPVYATAKTHSAMDIGKINDDLTMVIVPDNNFEIGTIGVKPFSIPHDAADPVGYSFFSDDIKVSIATDIGHVTGSLLKNLYGSDALLLESNHDIHMLEYGPYPYELKQRILGERGHLSNPKAAATALELVKHGTKHIMLGHLSEHNNLPEVAFAETKRLLEKADVCVGSDMTLQIASRYCITECAV